MNLIVSYDVCQPWYYYVLGIPSLSEVCGVPDYNDQLLHVILALCKFIIQSWREESETLPAVPRHLNNQIGPQVRLIDQTAAVVATYMRRIGVVGLDAHCHLSSVKYLISWIHFSPVCFSLSSSV